MITKNDMARVIIQALYLMPKLPAKDHPKVVRWNRCKKEDMQYQYELALKIINDKLVK